MLNGGQVYFGHSEFVESAEAEPSSEIHSLKSTFAAVGEMILGTMGVVLGNTIDKMDMVVQPPHPRILGGALVLASLAVLADGARRLFR